MMQTPLAATGNEPFSTIIPPTPTPPLLGNLNVYAVKTLIFLRYFFCAFPVDINRLICDHGCRLRYELID